ncbi:hypothetical protein Q2T40_16610 [Winogradskyella maritima]|uniref:Outer membrane protein with beta-barrel domain n=1 Tax=Winogradskyella maritima TaxID=1517766 RepID=A0ABV8AFY4_9FLAO|nr:hypothetical protein [Winogradskyella maritima]
MKKFIILLICLTLFQVTEAQDTYDINGERLELKSLSKGRLDLFMTTTDGSKRFFVKKDEGDFIELKQAIGANGQAQYISTLAELTNDSDVTLEKVKFTRASLNNFVGFYNYKKAIETEDGNRDYPVNFRFGFSGGVTNNPFVTNPDNILSPMFGVELELYGDTDTPRHSGFLQGRHSFSSDDFNYSATEFSLGYRFRIINQERFNIYVQTKFATLNFISEELPVLNGQMVTVEEVNETEFNLPLIFGLGTDIKVSDHSYLTLIFGELFAIFQENQGNFPTDIALGYKFNL